MKGMIRVAWILLWLIAAAWAGWRWGPALFPKVEAWLGAAGAERPAAAAGTPVGAPAEAGPVPSPMIAETTLDRVEALRSGASPDARLVLGSLEVTSVLRFTLPGILPPGVTDPTATFEGDRVRLSATVATSAFPDISAVAEIVGVLPDQVEMTLTGSLLPFDEGWAALQAEGVSAARVPLPGRFIAPVLEALGRRPREGLPSRALAIPLPSGIERVWIEGDQLVLVRAR